MPLRAWLRYIIPVIFWDIIPLTDGAETRHASHTVRLCCSACSLVSQRRSGGSRPSIRSTASEASSPTVHDPPNHAVSPRASCLRTGSAGRCCNDLWVRRPFVLFRAHTILLLNEIKRSSEEMYRGIHQCWGYAGRHWFQVSIRLRLDAAQIEDCIRCQPMFHHVVRAHDSI